MPVTRPVLGRARDQVTVLDSSQFSRVLSNNILIYRSRRQFAADRRQLSGLFCIQEDCEVVFVMAESAEPEEFTPTDSRSPLWPQFLEVDAEHEDGNSNTPDGMGLAGLALQLEGFHRVPSLEEDRPQFLEVEAPSLQVLPTSETAAASLESLPGHDASPGTSPHWHVS